MVLEDRYQTELRERRRRAHVQVLASAFSPDGEYLVAGTSEGRICGWHMPSLRANQPTLDQTAKADLSFLAHTGAAFTVCFTNNGGTLLSGGDDGVRVWDWSAVIGSQDEDVRPCAVLDTPRVEERGVVLPVPEINGIALLDNRLYGASGDGTAYEWDLATGQCLGRLEGHSGYLHAIVARPGTRQVVTGSEDATIRFWDVRNRSVVQTLWEPSGPGLNCHEPDKQRWIGCLAVDDADSWLVAGGGGRALTTWHMHSGTCAAIMPTVSTPQAAVFSHTGEIVTGGNEEWLYTWRTSGQLVCRAACTNRSVYTVSSDRTNQLVACGGTGGSMDVYVTPVSRTFSLSCF
eukprot:TRINITY_DN8490_c0_g1_i4.p1 TRINITY_DN8490_c0_g1~~TRINITY_DN8490_c0_g1_i4.p1  ORF type:complete len:347 (+),score=63.60 TRINITY_DN8490_c0_g1_i4:215-1255(+)